MKSLQEQMASYAAYHQNAKNKLTHFFGVPIVVFSLFLALSWFRFVVSDVPLTAGTIFYVGVMLYYLRLDATLALLQFPVSALILWLADRAALLPFNESLAIFAATFVGGWIIQLTGHYFEGRRPALVDNLSQIFNAPLFLMLELLFMVGARKELKRQVLRRLEVV